jgi:23S rRNA pseudouridine2605 synthase
MTAIRLQKILSAAGVASRRTAETLIAEGRVTVNGEVVRELGEKAEPTDDIRVDGRRVKTQVPRRYVLLYKPVNYVTTTVDPQQRPTVLTLLGPGAEGLYPVGRLDFDSEGLILLTNDGELADRLTHPRHEVPRSYEVRVFGVPDAAVLETLQKGVYIDGRKTSPAVVRLIRTFEKPSGRQSLIEITIHEGRNRQVRRMCQSVGLPVITLARTRIGTLTDTRLKPGMYRELRPSEVQQLRAAAGLARQPEAPVRTVSAEPRAGIRVPAKPGRPARAMRNKITLKEAARRAAGASRPAKRPAGKAAGTAAASRPRATGRPKPRKR